MEANESLEAALEREIREELGLKIRVEDEILTVEHEYPTKTVRLHFFNCTIVEGEPRPLEVADLQWVEPAELGRFKFPPADAGLIALLAERV